MTGTEQTQIEPMIFHQRIRLPYRYAPGRAQRAALEGFASGVIRGSRCEHCDIVLAPARPFCPRCFEATGAVVDLSDTGVLEGWTTRVRDGVATTFGLVRLDGADTVLMHCLQAGPDELAVGSRVKARWTGDKHGEITDIACFEPEGSRP